MRAPALVLAAVLLRTAPGDADERALEKVPLPPGARSELVQAELVQNGRTMSVATLSAVAPVEQTLAFYRERWAPAHPSLGLGERPGFLEDEVGGWSIISRLEAGVLLTVQLRTGDGGRAEGFLAAAAPGMSAEQASVPQPAGGELLSSTRAVDEGRAALTSVTAVTARPGVVAATYRDHFLDEGWAPSSERRVGEASVMRFARRGRRAEIVVTDSGRGETLVVLNEVSDAR